MGLRSALALGAAALALAVTAAGALGASIGAPTSGDSLLSDAGDSGYDVDHYSLQIGYQRHGNRLRGEATIDAHATEELAGFYLDLRSLRVGAVSVGSVPATFARLGNKVRVIPAATLAAGAPFQVRVRYAGHPVEKREADLSSDGWLLTPDGALALGEPQGSSSWFPSDNRPGDKATFDVRATVPRPLKAISNGSLLARERSGRRTTFVWQSPEPMTTYLATLAIGRFKLVHSTVDGIGAWTAFEPSEARSARRHLRELPKVLRFYSSRFGPYPFSSTGFIFAVDRASLYGALETQSRPTYFHDPAPLTFVHELAHQWFGDAVSPADWKQIWLNEGFAQFSQWLWKEHTGGPSVAQIFRLYYRHGHRIWNPAPARPGTSAHLFAASIYYRGGLALQALRAKLGDAVFFQILRDWVALNKYGNGTVPGFIALAERDSGRDLSRFFEAWLYSRGRPRHW